MGHAIMFAMTMPHHVVADLGFGRRGLFHIAVIHPVMIHLPVHWGVISTDDRDNLHHASMHVIKEVAVKRPIANMIGCDINRELLARFDDDSVFTGFVVTAAIHKVKEHAVQMDRMWHHRIIDHG